MYKDQENSIDWFPSVRTSHEACKLPKHFEFLDCTWIM